VVVCVPMRWSASPAKNRSDVCGATTVETVEWNDRRKCGEQRGGLVAMCFADGTQRLEKGIRPKEQPREVVVEGWRAHERGALGRVEHEPIGEHRTEPAIRLRTHALKLAADALYRVADEGHMPELAAQLCLSMLIAVQYRLRGEEREIVALSIPLQ